MIIRPSLPGMFVSSFENIWVTLASCAANVTGIRQANAKIVLVKAITNLSLERETTSPSGSFGNLGCGPSEPGFETDLAESRVLSGKQRSLADSRYSVTCVWIGDDFAMIVQRRQPPANELIYAELFRACDFDDAVYRLTNGNAQRVPVSVISSPMNPNLE